MNKELILKYDTELSRSLPIEYEGIKIYPVLFKDKKQYDLYVGSLLYNPVYYQDIELSSLPRLYFLTEMLNHKDDEQFILQHSTIYTLLISLFSILKLSLREQHFEFIANKSGRYCLGVFINGEGNPPVIINAKKFEYMRELILILNNTDYDDTYIHPDIQKWIEEQKRAEQKKIGDSTFSSPEDKIEAMMIEFKNPDESFLDNMTIRRVDKLYEKIINRELYNAQMSGMMSGMVTFKEQPTSWTFTKPHQTDFEKYLKPLK